MGFDYQQMFKIAREAKLETASQEELRRSKKFFRPRFKSVNHLHDNGSQLLDSPLAIIAEEFYDIFDKLKDLYAWVVKIMFKKSNRIYGEREDSHIVGRLTYYTRFDYLDPIEHMHVELWGRTFYGNWRKFAQGQTNINGQFRLGFDMTAIHNYNVRSNLHFKIYSTDSFTYKNGKAIPEFELFKTVFVNKHNLTGLEYNLGTIQLFYWEYMPNLNIARVTIKDHDEDAPQRYPDGRIDAISEQFIPIELIMKKHTIALDIGDDMSIEEIQEDYPKNLTAAMEEHLPGITRSDQWFAERMMNGMSSSTFDKDPENESLLWVHHHWKSYEHDDSEFALFNVSMKFELDSEGYLMPHEIQLKGKIHADGDPNELHIVKPTDGVRWEGAKRVARVSAGLMTEVDKHFAGTHLNTEQYAIAAYRNIRSNPVGALLFPHVKEVVLINHTAYQILVNAEGYICRATALKGAGLKQRVEDVMGTLDWKAWRPMDIISDKHIYAKAAHLYYDIISEYIEDFFEDHLAEIIKYWHELYCFSEDLVEHSSSTFICKHLEKALKLNPEKFTVENMPSWFNTSNRMDLSIDRLRADNTRKAISRVISKPVFENNHEELENLKEMCAYVIFNATFEHFWANSKQYDDIGEIKYCSLGLRYGSTEHGVLGPEDDDEIAPNKKLSTQLMWWSNMLSRTGYGFIMSNEDGDINPKLIEKLKAKEQAFADLGVSIYEIQSRTNI